MANVETSWLFEATKKAAESGCRGILHEGGSRSGKTKNISIFIVFHLISNKYKGFVYTIARDWRTNLDRTVWRDIKWALGCFGLLDKCHINSTKYTIELFGNTIQGIGINDDPMLVFGLEQTVFWVNEANATSREAFDQMEMRTGGFWILDYNPKDLEHWVYGLELRADVKTIRSTVLDNPFVPKAMYDKIMSYNPAVALNIEQKTADAFKWKVFGLGQRGTSETNIFNSYMLYEEQEEPVVFEWCYYGGDFGYTSPSALIQVKKVGINLYLKEVLYEAGLTNQQIAQRIEQFKDEVQFWDSAEAKSITELRLCGVNAYSAIKGEGSVYFGLQVLRNFNLYLCKSSSSLIKEVQTAKWATDKGGLIVKDSKGRPIHENTNSFHCLAAARYAVTKIIGNAGQD